jgi:hypothetical protein
LGLVVRRLHLAYGVWRTSLVGSNQALERTATRRVFMFQMIKTISDQAKPGDGGSRSSCSR